MQCIPHEYDMTMSGYDFQMVMQCIPNDYDMTMSGYDFQMLMQCIPNDYDMTISGYDFQMTSAWRLHVLIPQNDFQMYYRMLHFEFLSGIVVYRLCQKMVRSSKVYIEDPISVSLCVSRLDLTVDRANIAKYRQLRKKAKIRTWSQQLNDGKKLFIPFNYPRDQHWLDIIIWKERPKKEARKTAKVPKLKFLVNKFWYHVIVIAYTCESHC